jgi:hypothetical protein
MRRGIVVRGRRRKMSRGGMEERREHGLGEAQTDRQTLDISLQVR